MDNNTDAKRILSTLPPEDWRRPRGRRRITWLSTIQQDLRSHNLTLPEAMDMTQNWSLWRMWSTYGATQSWVACQNAKKIFLAWLLIFINLFQLHFINLAFVLHVCLQCNCCNSNAVMVMVMSVAGRSKKDDNKDAGWVAVWANWTNRSSEFCW